VTGDFNAMGRPAADASTPIGTAAMIPLLLTIPSLCRAVTRRSPASLLDTDNTVQMFSCQVGLDGRKAESDMGEVKPLKSNE
jgi:hypothetical protein